MQSTNLKCEMGTGHGREGTLRWTPGRWQVRGIPVSMGNPHYVIFVHEFRSDWQARARGNPALSAFHSMG